MQNNKNFGIGDSLIETVKEALKGNQKKLDVDGDGKLEKSDFEKLRARKEEVEIDEAKTDAYHKTMLKALGKSRLPRGHGYTSAVASNGDFVVYDGGKRIVGRLKKGEHSIKEEVELDEAQKPYVSSGENGSWHVMNSAGKIHKTFTRKEGGIKAANAHLSKNYNKLSKVKEEVSDAAKKILGDKAKEHGGKVPFTSTTYKDGKKVVTRGHNDEKGNRVVTSVKNEEVAEADDAVAKQIAAKKEQLKKQIQQKIAQKQMSVMQKKAQKKIQDIKASNDKDVDDNMKKKGKDEVEVNPELREAEDLPKKVIKKGHEIAKSLIKHKAKVDEPYAVGMAQAKKSAGIKD